MAASPRIMTVGDTVYARDASVGDILKLNENMIPVWDDARAAEHVDPTSAKIGDLIQALIDAGLMKAE